MSSHLTIPDPLRPPFDRIGKLGGRERLEADRLHHTKDVDLGVAELAPLTPERFESQGVGVRFGRSWST